MPDAVLCKLEWLNPDGSWFLAHAGVPLLRPKGYLERLAREGRVARVTLLETGEVLQADSFNFI